jgi:ribosomal protein S18 acetylase RimI-like enzyme
MMNVDLREAEIVDIAFLRKMLYEAVFWRDRVNKPSFEEGLAYPEVSKSLADWEERDGDVAVVATIDSTPIGAAWYRFWNDDNFIRGYVDKETPVLVIGVQSGYRHKGVGTKMIAWLIGYASKQGIERISLMVSKDNNAINLYKHQGFEVYFDKGDSFIMVRNLT